MPLNYCIAQGSLMPLTARSSERISCIFPALYATAEDLYIFKPFLHVFYCPTGSTRLFWSGTIENYLLFT